MWDIETLVHASSQKGEARVSEMCSLFVPDEHATNFRIASMQITFENMSFRYFQIRL